MSDFSADWLSLREPADRRARSARVLDALQASLADRQTVRITDLGCGTGATLRALSAWLPEPQCWLLVDKDPALLTQAVQRAAASSIDASVQTRQADLMSEIESIVAVPADLVTASAFLDLVSVQWLDRLVASAAQHRRPVYIALSYDGRTRCDPVDPFDAAVLGAFNTHQRRDKGLGGALGPEAVGAAIARFEAAGFTVTRDQADWQLNPAQSALQTQLLQGWHGAARETGLLSPRDLDAWLTRRLNGIEQAQSWLRVGHVDLWASPPQG